MQSPASEYRREVNKRISCPKALKQPFLKQLEAEALCFCAEHDSADIHMLCARFGSPEEVAEEFLAELNNRTVAYYNSKRKRILRFTVAVLFASVLMLVFLGIQRHYLQQKLTAEEFIASITYENASDGKQSLTPSQDTILGNSGSVQDP